MLYILLHSCVSLQYQFKTINDTVHIKATLSNIHNACNIPYFKSFFNIDRKFFS